MARFEFPEVETEVNSFDITVKHSCKCGAQVEYCFCSNCGRINNYKSTIMETRYFKYFAKETDKDGNII